MLRASQKSRWVSRSSACAKGQRMISNGSGSSPSNCSEYRS
ncbi:Uncharacterised protein [Vibrio cholerae]|uniref:Uncharacterized protein n=1 Tax=Vibrio cholerae TaxID=666 RepID=A0A655WP14_VIBCL|nr:Uncharacterised protein [Vibrio cholerae]